ETWLLVRTPAQEARAVPESPAGEVIVANLGHQPRLERLPLPGTLGAPPAGAARGASGEAGRLPERTEPSEECFSLPRGEPRGEGGVVEKALAVVEAEEERADHRSIRGIAEASHHAVGGALALDLLHAGAITRAIVEIDALGHHPIEGAARHGEPFPRDGDLGRGGGEAATPDVLQLAGPAGVAAPSVHAESPLPQEHPARPHY